jgi:KDO2-lipid IV(A) lauroyltransferase
VLKLLFRSVAALSLAEVHRGGGFLGKRVFWLSPTYRRRLRQNLAPAGYQDPAPVRDAAAVGAGTSPRGFPA